MNSMLIVVVLDLMGQMYGLQREDYCLFKLILISIQQFLNIIVLEDMKSAYLNIVEEVLG